MRIHQRRNIPWYAVGGVMVTRNRAVWYVAALQVAWLLHAKSNPCSGDAAQRIAGYAEEDAFFVFTNLMAEFRDLYCVAADNSNFGINVRS
jgi:hypothetical protein